MITWAAMLSTLAVQVHGAAPIWVGTGSGLYKSTDAGASWAMVNVPLPSLLSPGQLNVLALRKDPQNPSKVYLIGLAKGAWAFFATQDGGQTWTATPFVGITPNSTGPNGLEVDFAGQVIYISASSAGTSASLLYKSTDLGATWTQLKISNTVSFSPAVKIVADPLVSGTVYSLTSNNEFLKSTDFGGSWTKIGGPGITQTSGGIVPQTTTLNIKVDPRNPLIWYFGTDHSSFPATCPLTNGGLCGLFKSTDGGATFTGLSIPINYVSSVSFGTVSSTVYATGNVAGLGPTVMRSTDSGGTWTPLVDGLFTAQSGEVWADPTDPSTIYVDDSVGSNTSFHVSTDGGATFSPRPTPVGPPTCVPGNCTHEPIYDLLIVPSMAPVQNAFGGSATIAPNTWVKILGPNLAPAGDARSWQAADFTGGQMPVQLDGVSATVNGKSAYVEYISSSQVNILTPPDAMSGSVNVVLANNGTNTSVTAQAAAISPSFFVFDGTHIVAQHLNYSDVGPTTLYPGLTTPAKPSEEVILYANGFGPTSQPVISGSVAQGGTLPTLPVVFIGGVQAQVLYAGLAGVGEFQFNVIVPASTPDGDIPLVATYGGQSTPAGVVITVHQ